MCRACWIAAVAIVFWASAAAGQEGDRSGSESSDSRREASRIRQEEPPLTPGFGEAIDRGAVPGFGLDAGDAAGGRNRGVPLEDRYHQRVVAYADQIIERYDRNRSGKLEREEWASARWRSDPAGSDLNKDGTLTREELCERVKGYDEFRGLTATRSAESGGGSSSTTDRAKLEEYAKGLMKRYDRNDNSVLERDEWEGMSSFHRGADANDDDVITRDELADRLANYANSDGGGPSSSNDQRGSEERSAGDSSSNKAYRTAGNRTTGRENYRVRSATERLPKGLPDWFARNDADADGQISMAEFAVSWTDEKIEEFARHDVNGDGLITPQECLSDAPAKSAEKPAERSRDWRSRGR